MNRIMKRFAAALCSGAVLSSLTSFAVRASDSEDIVLPSGMTVAEVEHELAFNEGDVTNGSGNKYGATAVGIFMGDDVLLEGYYAKSDIENDIPTSMDTVFEWGSISQTLVWVSAMQLWEQGKLDLGRDVREYLPDGFFQRLSYDDPITMLDLMNHQGGWQETTRPLFVNDGKEIPPLKDALQDIEPEQVFRPHTVTACSNYGSALAGYVVECISGTDYCEYVHMNILEPLGMEHTAINADHSDNEWVQEQRKKEKCYEFLAVEYIDLGNQLYYCPVYPCCSAAGTISDLMTYAQALADKDSPLFESSDTWKEMFTGTSFYGDSDIPSIAHGFLCDEHSVCTFGHSGDTEMSHADMILDLDSGTGLVLMTNQQGDTVNNFAAETPELVFGKLSPDKYTSDTVEKAKLSGYYLNARGIHKGMLKFAGYLDAVNAGRLGEALDIGDGVYQINRKIPTIVNMEIRLDESSELYAVGELSDGTAILHRPDEDRIQHRYYLAELGLLTLYFLAAAAGAFLILTKHRLKKHGRLEKSFCSSMMTVGYAAGIVSVITLLTVYIIFSRTGQSLPQMAEFTAGKLQLLCVLLCAFSAVTAVTAVIREKKRIAYYIANTAYNGIVIGAVLFFEMYR